MNRFIIAIALALGAGTGAHAALASDDTDSICMLELEDVPHVQEAGPPAAVERVAADVARDTFAARAARAAALGDDQALDAISVATPIERGATAYLSLPAENHDDLPIHARPRTYRKQAMDRHRDVTATAAATPERSMTARRARE